MNGVVPPLEKLIVRGVLGEDNMVFSLCSYHMAKGNSLLMSKHQTTLEAPLALT